MTNPINLTDLQDQINSRQLTELKLPTKRTEKQEQVIETTWEILTDIYGSGLTSQYGDVMPEAWIMLLKGITPTQITEGLGRIKGRNSSFPPNGEEFRQLCMPETISPDGVNSSAYLSFDDPKHPRNDPTSAEYVRPQSKLIEHVSKRKVSGNKAIKGILEGF